MHNLNNTILNITNVKCTKPPGTSSWTSRCPSNLRHQRVVICLPVQGFAREQRPENCKQNSIKYYLWISANTQYATQKNVLIAIIY